MIIAEPIQGETVCGRINPEFPPAAELYEPAVESRVIGGVQQPQICGKGQGEGRKRGMSQRHPATGVPRQEQTPQSGRQDPSRQVSTITWFTKTFQAGEAIHNQIAQQRRMRSQFPRSGNCPVAWNQTAIFRLAQLFAWAEGIFRYDYNWPLSRHLGRDVELVLGARS